MAETDSCNTNSIQNPDFVWASSVFSQLFNSLSSVQFSHSVVSNFCNPMYYSTPGFPVHHQLQELTQTHVHRVSDAIQPSHPLLSPCPPTFILPSIRVFSSESVICIRWPKYWEFQLQHQSFQ